LRPRAGARGLGRHGDGAEHGIDGYVKYLPKNTAEVEALEMNVRDRISEPLRKAALATRAQLGRVEVLESERARAESKA
jgi:hypothetical protein